jgi:hypothetical protein
MNTAKILSVGCDLGSQLSRGESATYTLQSGGLS